jgi:hypothetical protein
MLQLFLGVAILVAAGVAFRMALPVGGRARPWLTPVLEPYVAVAFVASAGVAVVLIVSGIGAALR